MAKNWVNAPASNAAGGINIIRVAVALILSVHGFHGIFTYQNMPGFGQYLSSVGFPAGVVFAWGVVVVQIAASVALVVGRFVVPACIAHMVVLITGIILIHASSGWFVVGPGQNGVEYSVTLVTCLAAVLWAYWPRK